MLPGNSFTVVVPVSGALTVANGVGLAVALPCNAELVRVSAAVGTAPTGAALIVNVAKNGTAALAGTTLSPKVTIPATNSKVVVASPSNPNAGVNQTGSTVQDPAAIGGLWASGDVLTVNVEQVGSTVAGSNLTVLCQFVIK